MRKTCSYCQGEFNVACVHGTIAERAEQARLSLPALAKAAAVRQRAGRKLPNLPADLREGQCGEAIDIAAARFNVSASYVRQMMRIEEVDASLHKRVINGEMPIYRAFNRVKQPGSEDDQDTWLTPESLLIRITAALGGQIDLDPATTASNPTNARDFYSAERGEDGLNQSWTRDRAGRAINTIYLNPPYSRPLIEHFVKKAIESSTRARVLALLPASTDSELVQGALRQCTDALFLRGRVSFSKPLSGQAGSATFGSVLLAFGNVSVAPLSDLGEAMRPLTQCFAAGSNDPT